MARSLTTAAPDAPWRLAPRRRGNASFRAAIDVFAAHGYFNAKISAIAKAAGVADGTIYLYFDTKEDLLVTIFQEHTILSEKAYDLAEQSNPLATLMLEGLL